jgi:hypothetical protein
MKPTIGRIVVFESDSHEFNGTTTHPAVVTRVWGDTDPAAAKGAQVCVNLTVLPDCHAPLTRSSVSLFETREEALASGNSDFAYWPPRA